MTFIASQALYNMLLLLTLQKLIFKTLSFNTAVKQQLLRQAFVVFAATESIILT